MSVRIREQMMKELYPVLIKVVEDVRHELSLKYDVENKASNFYKYTALCDIACNMFKEHFMELHKAADPFTWFLKPVSIKFDHGEQKHNPQLLSKYWILQHTWIEVEFVGKEKTKLKFYIDPTSSQFTDYYEENLVPKYWVSITKPPYVVSDKRNLAFHPKLTKLLNENILVPTIYDGERRRCGIIEFFQYEIWGRISDIIHKFKYDKW